MILSVRAANRNVSTRLTMKCIWSAGIAAVPVTLSCGKPPIVRRGERVMRRRENGTCMTQREYEHSLVIDRCVAAIHDYGTREGATRSKVMASLKRDGFTTSEISQAVDKFKTTLEETDHGAE